MEIFLGEASGMSLATSFLKKFQFSEKFVRLLGISNFKSVVTPAFF